MPLLKVLPVLTALLIATGGSWGQEVKPAPAPAKTSGSDAPREEAKPGMSKPAAELGKRLQMSPEERAQALQKMLKLTDEQTAKVKKIITDNHQANVDEVKSVVADESLSREEKRKEITKFLQATGDEINEILTPEQKERWQEIRKRRMEMSEKRAAEEKK